LVFTVFFVLARTARADGGEGGFVATVNGFQIALVFQEPARVGDNEFHIQITDAMGMPVPNAEVEVTAMLAETVSEHQGAASGETSGMDEPDNHISTPSSEMIMGGMDMSTEIPSHGTDLGAHAEPAFYENFEPINVTLEQGMKGGEYTGAIHLDRAGEWTFRIHFIVNGEINEVEFPVNIVAGNPRTGILAGFIGFNTSIIAVAAILKRKSVFA
jgi:hypothetical protein